MAKDRPFNRTFETNSNGLWPEFYSLVWSRGWSHVKERRYAGAIGSLNIEGAYATSEDLNQNTMAAFWILEDDDYTGAIYITHAGETSFASTVFTVYSDSPENAQKLVEKIYELCPEADGAKEDEITCWFWRNAAQGPKKSNRNLDALKWKDIKDNYPHADGLDHLMDGFIPGVGGQLVLWNGEPGTGKTSALRALACEWRSFCQLHYIVDPDAFFGSSADYMMSVLMEFGSQPTPDYWFEDHDIVRSERPKEQWRLVVLEDCGEMLRPDARQEIGQALSRLLNVCDGLIGRGLKFLVLVTTNEEIGKLHEAVSRPGRCAARVEFKPFHVDEANAWLKDHGYEGEVKESKTLADLYALIGNFGVAQPLTEFGFQ